MNLSRLTSRPGPGPLAGQPEVMAARRRRQRHADVYPIHPTTTRPLHLAAESGAAAAAGRPERQSRPPPGGVLEGGGRVGWARWGGGPGGGWKRRGDGWGMKRMSLARGGRPGKGGGSAWSAQALAPARRGRRICQCGVRAGQGKGGGCEREGRNNSGGKGGGGRKDGGKGEGVGWRCVVGGYEEKRWWWSGRDYLIGLCGLGMRRIWGPMLV